jgi:uncharacterized protein (TIGR00730 family)
MPSRPDRPALTPDLTERINAFVDGLPVGPNRDLVEDLLADVVALARPESERLDLKIASAALAEMQAAFAVFRPYRQVPKVTIFGSARTRSDDPLYAQARDLAAALATHGWMVITGAGPGIMAAGLEGAGREMSFGINIRLPFEQGANEFIADDPKLVEMKYFFTRKLMLLKESDGFAVLPGGFGTLDEAFELLTLIQTGKAEPAPIVLLEVPGGSYWHAWERFVHEELARRGLIADEDCALFRITDDVAVAVDEIIGFYRNYHSRRYVGDLLVVRLRVAPTDEEVARLNEQFADLVVRGRIQRSAPLPPEVRGQDHLELPRLTLRFNRMHHGRLRSFIDALNRLPSAPRETVIPTEGRAQREEVAGGLPMEADLRTVAQAEGETEP